MSTPSFGQPGYNPGGQAVAPRDNPRGVTQGRVVQPAAISSGAQSAAYGLGQILKDIVAGIPQVFRTENEQLAAHTAIDKFISASVPQSAMAALSDGTERAPIEDVTKRPTPAGSSYSIPQNNQPVQIDYDRLAEAMVRAQLQIQADNAAQAPTTLVSDQPAPADDTEADYNEHRLS